MLITDHILHHRICKAFSLYAQNSHDWLVYSDFAKPPHIHLYSDLQEENIDTDMDSMPTYRRLSRLAGNDISVEGLLRFAETVASHAI